MEVVIEMVTVIDNSDSGNDDSDTVTVIVLVIWFGLGTFFARRRDFLRMDRFWSCFCCGWSIVVRYLFP